MAPVVPQLAGLVLAAGGATRFGGNKVLARWRGEALVVRAARLLGACCPAGVTVVVGADAEAVAAAVRADIPAAATAVNAGWQQGLAGSLATGLAALPASATAALVLLADQPAVDADDLAQLLAAASAAPGRIVAAGFAGTVGVPAILPRACWPALRALTGDQGARTVIAAAADRVVVALPHAGIDVDTPEDLARLPP